MEGTVHDNGGEPGGMLLQTEYSENIKPPNPSTKDRCITEDMEEGDYLMMDPACEVNEKSNRRQNDGNEVIEEGRSPPLDLDSNEIIEADAETLSYAEEDWQDPEQTEVPKNLEPAYRLRYRHDRVTGQDSRRSTTISSTTISTS